MVVKGGSHLCAPELLPPLPAGRPPAPDDRDLDGPPGVPLHRPACARLTRQPAARPRAGPASLRVGADHLPGRRLALGPVELLVDLVLGEAALHQQSRSAARIMSGLPQM